MLFLEKISQRIQWAKTKKKCPTLHLPTLQLYLARAKVSQNDQKRPFWGLNIHLLLKWKDKKKSAPNIRFVCSQGPVAKEHSFMVFQVFTFSTTILDRSQRPSKSWKLPFWEILQMQTVAKNWSIEGVKYRKDTKHATVWHCFTLLPYLPSLFLLKYQPSLLLISSFPFPWCLSFELSAFYDHP